LKKKRKEKCIEIFVKTARSRDRRNIMLDMQEKKLKKKHTQQTATPQVLKRKKKKEKIPQYL